MLWRSPQGIIYLDRDLAPGRMCYMALDYTSEYDLKFNRLKCRMINYSDNINIVFIFDGVDLNAKSEGPHSGDIIGPKVFSNLIQDASYTLAHHVNYVLNNFTHCSYNVKYQPLK